jgi:hypothetical protein
MISLKKLILEEKSNIEIKKINYDEGDDRSQGRLYIIAIISGQKFKYNSYFGEDGSDGDTAEIECSLNGEEIESPNFNAPHYEERGPSGRGRSKMTVQYFKQHADQIIKKALSKINLIKTSSIQPKSKKMIDHKIDELTRYITGIGVKLVDPRTDDVYHGSGTSYDIKNSEKQMNNLLSGNKFHEDYGPGNGWVKRGSGSDIYWEISIGMSLSKNTPWQCTIMVTWDKNVWKRD